MLWVALTFSLSIRDAESTGRCLGALSAAMFRKRSSFCSSSESDDSSASCWLCAAGRCFGGLGGPESDSEDSSIELAMCRGGRELVVELRCDGALVYVCCGCGVLFAFTASRCGLDCDCDCDLCEPPEGASPDCWNCCWAEAKSDGVCWELRRAMSEFPRVTNVTGGPRELSMP